MSEFLICYDIADPRRLAQLHRHLKKWAAPIQYSVFLMTADERQLERHISEAAKLINPAEDDLRVYPLPKRGFRARLGAPALPAGIQWSGMPSAW